MTKVLFNSSRPLGRCENLTAVWNAYDGEKVFVKNGFADVSYRPQTLVVTDEFVHKKRPDQTVVMVDHSVHGGKLYGIDQPHGVYKRETCSLIDWYVTSSEHARTFAASSAGIPMERCLPLGVPRTDAYVGKRKGDGNTFLAKFARAYLFAPTFRASWEPKAPEIDWAALDARLEDDEVLVVKRHMVAGSPLTSGAYSHIVEVDSSEPSTPYLIDADVVVTDYSSIVLDGYLLGKPSVLFCPNDDLAAYKRTRGFYMDYPSAYGHVTCNGAGALVMSARLALLEGMNDVERGCMEKCAGACDGHSTERVIELIRSLA